MAPRWSSCPSSRPGGAGKGDELFLSLLTPSPTPHSRTPPSAGSGQPSLFPSSPGSGAVNARPPYRVTITELGCQRHPRAGLQTPPQLKGGASGPSRRLYSAVIDVSQASVTPSGGTQSVPMLGPGSLFLSPPFIWQSKVCEPPGPSRPGLGLGWDKGGRCTQRPPGGLYLPGRVMLIQPQPRALLHMDGRLPAWLGQPLGMGSALGSPREGMAGDPQG